MSPTCSIDAIRAAYPHLRVALYAYEPKGSVTLELIAPDDQTFTFTAPTAHEAAALACPELFAADPPAAEPDPTTLFD
jgi:hypothetical protein